MRTQKLSELRNVLFDNEESKYKKINISTVHSLITKAYEKSCQDDPAKD